MSIFLLQMESAFRNFSETEDFADLDVNVCFKNSNLFYVHPIFFYVLMKIITNRLKFEEVLFF